MTPSVPPLTKDQHASIARRLGGKPIFYQEEDGSSRAAVQLPSGELLLDYRKEIHNAIHTAVREMADHTTFLATGTDPATRPPFTHESLTIPLESARHLSEMANGRSLSQTLETLIEIAKQKESPESPETPETHTITFYPDGTARALTTDVIPLHDLGPLTIRRASNVDFNESTQKWEVRIILPDSTFAAEVSYTNTSRQACLDWEREFFEGVGACLLDELPHGDRDHLGRSVRHPAG